VQEAGQGCIATGGVGDGLGDFAPDPEGGEEEHDPGEEEGDAQARRGGDGEAPSGPIRPPAAVEAVSRPKTDPRVSAGVIWAISAFVVGRRRPSSDRR